MRIEKISLVLLVVIAFALAAISCSNGESPVEPSASLPDTSTEFPQDLGSQDISERNIISIYQAEIDPGAGTFTIEPIDRANAYHLPLSVFFPDILAITDFGFSPNFWANIRLNHPMQGSGIDGFDPRVITVLPANPGVSMDYPNLDVHANNSVVLNPDGYTKLWDEPTLTGNANPFVAYFKGQQYRKWSSSDVVAETKRWDLDLGGFSGPMAFKLIVDISTNYPDPSEPIVGNAPEPVDIELDVQPGLTPNGGQAVVDVTLLDWQGRDGIGGVQIEAPDLFNGTANLSFNHIESDNKYLYRGVLVNELLAPEGEYDILIASWDTNTGIYIYEEFVVEVEYETGTYIDVTPPWLNFTPKDIFVDGDYTYIAGSVNGFHVFDTSDPENPVWLNMVPTSDEALEVYVSGDYAYVADATGGLQIINIETPEFPFNVSSLYLNGEANSVHVVGDYAYLANEDMGLQIVNISQPGNPVIEGSLCLPGNTHDIFARGNYVYIICNTYDMNVIDISDPQAAEIVEIYESDKVLHDIYIHNHYAYLTYSTGIKIVDIENPSSPELVGSTWGSSDILEGIFVIGDYAYLAGNRSLDIIDINPPEDASLVHSVPITGNSSNVYISGNYGYLADSISGMHIFDVTDPETATLISTAYSAGYTRGVACSGEHAYLANRTGGVHIVDVSTPELAYTVSVVDAIDESWVDTNKVGFQNGYAFTASSYTGMGVIDVLPAESAHLIMYVGTSGSIKNIHIDGDYAYTISPHYGYGLDIVDISIPESANIAKVFSLNHGAEDIYVADGYAYAAIKIDGLEILDVDPLMDMYSVKVVTMPQSPIAVCYADGYAYVAITSSGLYIADVDPPSDAFVANIVDTPGYSYDICISGNYAYVATSYGVQVVNITEPETAFLEHSIDTPGTPTGIVVVDGYIYVSVSSGGMRIIKL
jgi:hypothetical protein